MSGHKSDDSGVQGEGDYRAAHDHKRDIDRFMRDKSGEIGSLAKDAEKAVEGPGGKELKKAEEKGESRARH